MNWIAVHVVVHCPSQTGNQTLEWSRTRQHCCWNWQVCLAVSLTEELVENGEQDFRTRLCISTLFQSAYLQQVVLRLRPDVTSLCFPVKPEKPRTHSLVPSLHCQLLCFSNIQKKLAVETGYGATCTHVCIQHTHTHTLATIFLIRSRTSPVFTCSKQHHFGPSCVM